MGNICSDNYETDFINNSYYKKNFDDDFILVLNADPYTGISKPFCFFEGTEEEKIVAKNFLKKMLVHPFHSMAKETEEKNSELREVSMNNIKEINNSNKLDTIQIIHYNNIPIEFLLKHNINPIQIEKFIYLYLFDGNISDL